MRDIRVYSQDPMSLRAFDMSEDLANLTFEVRCTTLEYHPKVERLIGEIMKRKYEIEALGFQPKYLFIGKELFETIVVYNQRLTGGISFDEFAGLNVIYSEDFIPTGFKIVCDSKTEFFHNPNQILRRKI